MNKIILIIVLAVSLSGCASGYQTFYKPASNADDILRKRASPPPTTPALERTQASNADEVLNAYAKRGYIMIGTSIFNSGRHESEYAAIEQAQKVEADLVLIINPKHTGSYTTEIPITTPTTSTAYSTGTATAYGPGGTVTAYGSGTTTVHGTKTDYIPVTQHRFDFGAVFFVKPKMNLGILTRDLTDPERKELQSNKGIAVRVVADGGKAYDADILVGDIITMVDGEVISNIQSFNQLVGERKGKLVRFSVVRSGKRIEKEIQLKADI